MKQLITGTLVIAALIAAVTGFSIGMRQAVATQTTWGNLKCQYNPNCPKPSPRPTQDPVDNKNEG